MDIRTLTQSCMIVELLLALALVFVWTTRKTYPGFGAWVLQFIAGAIGYELLALRQALPLFISVLMGNGLHMAGILAAFEGTMRFSNKKYDRRLGWAMFVLAECGLAYFLFAAESLAARVEIVSFFIGAGSLAIGWVMFFRTPGELRASARFFASVLTFYGGFMTFRGIVSIFFPPEAFLAPGTMQAATFLISPGITILAAFGLVMLNSQRLEQEMIQDIEERKRAEEALLSETAFLEALINSSSDGIFVTEAKHQRVSGNQKAVDMWRLPSGLVRDEERLRFIAGEVSEPQRLLESRRYLQEHPDETVHLELNLKSGECFDTSSSPVLGRRGERHGRIWRFRDITENKRYWNMLEALSTTDGLTGIANRRRLDEFLEREWRRSMRSQSWLSLILMDIDYFKQFNDRYGHQEGDECLKRVAVTLRNVVTRPADLVARYGGEEFACILPETDLTGALTIARMIRDDFDRVNLSHACSPVKERVTMSFGVASLIPRRGQSQSDLVGRADTLLYTAKNAGRDRIVSGESDASESCRAAG